jgi:hypothetical protein
VGGWVYERRDNVPEHLSLRGRMMPELEAFGPYAARMGTEGIEPYSVSAPTRRAGVGQTIITRFVVAAGLGSGAEVSECLATFKPDRPGPYHVSFLIAALADELTEFARTRVLSGFDDTVRSISLVQGTPLDLRVDGHPVLGWALLAKGATGIAVDHRDRVLMWLGAEDRAVIPASIYTSDKFRFAVSGRITSTD